MLTGAGEDLIFDKWLLVKLPVCAKYVIIISGQMNLEVKMLSNTMSTTSKYDGVQKSVTVH